MTMSWRKMTNLMIIGSIAGCLWGPWVRTNLIYSMLSTHVIAPWIARTCVSDL